MVSLDFEEYLRMPRFQTFSEYLACKYPPPPIQPPSRWTDRQRLEGEAADRAMIRLLKEESTWE